MNPYLITRGFGSFAAPDDLAPAIYSLSAYSGGLGSGLTIIGANFGTATSVTFNGTPANYSIVNPAIITTFVPAGATTGPIVVTNPDGMASSVSFLVSDCIDAPFSYTSAQIILAIQNQLVLGTGLDISKVVIARDPNRVPSILEQHLTIRLEGHNPITYVGAGRLGFRVVRNFVVYLFSRFALDEAGYSNIALTQAVEPNSGAIGHYGFEDQVINCMTLRPLLTITPPYVKMTNCPIYFLPGASPAQMPTPDPTWIQTFLMFKIDHNFQLCLDPTLDGFS